MKHQNRPQSTHRRFAAPFSECLGTSLKEGVANMTGKTWDAKWGVNFEIVGKRHVVISLIRVIWGPTPMHKA